MDAPETSRRWWRNHQLNVLIVIAIIAVLGLVWVGIAASTVQHRRAMREQIYAAGGRFDESYDDSFQLLPMVRPAVRHNGVSSIRQLLGDRRVGTIFFWRPLTAADREAAAAFPESKVMGFP